MFFPGAEIFTLSEVTPISTVGASILAKVERDNYIYDLCKKYPKLDEYYDLSKK